jgi:hypothetical protein
MAWIGPSRANRSFNSGFIAVDPFQHERCQGAQIDETDRRQRIDRRLAFHAAIRCDREALSDPTGMQKRSTKGASATLAAARFGPHASKLVVDPPGFEPGT